MGRVFSIAVLHPNSTRLSDDVKKRLAAGPLDIGGGVSLRAIPSWLQDAGAFESLNPRQKSWSQSSEHCLWYALDQRPDHAQQLLAIQRLVNSNLALWLAAPNGLGFEVVLFQEQRGAKWNSRASFTVAQLKPHWDDFGNQVTLKSVKTARRINRSICDLTLGSSIDIAKRALQRALLEDDWWIRYLMLWVGLEALFGTDREVSYRVSLRLSSFLEGKSGKGLRENRYKIAKNCYEWRSRLVHGASLQKLKSEKSKELLWESERMLQESMSKLLLLSGLRQRFEEGREAYLDGLLFEDQEL